MNKRQVSLLDCFGKRKRTTNDRRRKTTNQRLDKRSIRIWFIMIWEIGVILFWSLFVITWASYGMNVIKEYIRTHNGE